MEAVTVDLFMFDFVLAILVGLEAVFVFVLRVTRPRSSSRTQSLVGMLALALFGILTVSGAGVRMAHGEHVHGPDEVASALFEVMASMLLISIFILLTTFLWHEWKENGVHKREPGGDE